MHCKLIFAQNYPESLFPVRGSSVYRYLETGRNVWHQLAAIVLEQYKYFLTLSIFFFLYNSYVLIIFSPFMLLKTNN